MTKIILVLTTILLLGGTVLYSQDAPNQIKLDEAVSKALAQGAENKILQGNLDVARFQYQQTAAKNAFNLSTTGSYTLGQKYNDYSLASTAGSLAGVSAAPVSSNDSEGSAASPTLTGKALNAPVLVPAALSGSLSASTPLTKASVTGTQYLQQNPDGTWSNTSGIGLSLTQTLWDGYPGGAALATVDKGFVSLQSTQLSTTASQLSLVYTIKQAYYTMLSAQNNIKTYQDTLDSRKNSVHILQSRFDLNQAAAIDLQTAQVNEKSAEVDLQQGYNVLRNARIRLGNLMGIPQEQDFILADEPDPQVNATTMDAAVKNGLTQRLEFKTLELNQKLQTIDLSLVKGQAGPSVSLTGGVNLLQDWATQRGGQAASVGVKIGLPVIDGGLLQSQVGSDSAQLQVYDVQKLQLTRTITADIQDAFNTYHVSLQRLDVAQQNVDTQKLQVEIDRAKNDAGALSNFDLQTEELAYTTAVYALAQARITAQLAALQLQNVMGY